MIPRYSRPEMVAIWSPETRFRIWFEIEAHAADAQAELGVIPKEAAAAIWKARDVEFDVARIDEIEAVTKHDVIAFLTHLADHVGDEARFVHQGMTSSDVLDTCLNVQLVRAADILIADEPTTALDVTIQAQILDLMRDLKARLGSAIMLITHDLAEAVAMSDRILVMSERPGRIVDEHHGVVVGDCLESGPHGIGALAAAVHEADGRSACGVDAADDAGGLGFHIWADQHNDLIDHAGGQQRAHGALQEGAPAQLDISLGHLGTEAGALAGGRDERDDARFSLRRRRRGHRDRCRCRYRW